MVELTNTKVHTAFKHISGEIEITGNAVIGKDDVIESIYGDIKNGVERVCGFSAYKGIDGKLQYNINTTDISKICEVIPALEGIEASVIVALKEGEKEA
ncbi:MAG: hypothetical protein J6U47_00655 [Bacteroidales bacterium]|nr:hypothetical protein [Bacteroidales bacterium]